MEIGRGMHSFVQIFLLNIGVPIDVNDTNILGRDTGNPAHGGIPDAVISSQNNGHGSRTGNVSDGVTDLIETLFDIGRNGKDVAGIAERHLFSQINAAFVIVGRVEGTDATNALRTKASTGTVGTSTIKGNPHDGGVVISHQPGIFDVGSLEEGIDPGKVRQFSAAKGRNGLVFDGGGTWQS